MKTMIDPPCGSIYGFPKELKEGQDYAELLRESGYPEDQIEFAMKYSRMWRVEGEEK